MRYYRSIIATIACVSLFAGATHCSGQARQIVKLYQNPRGVDESFAKHWPSTMKGGGAEAFYTAPTMPDGSIGSLITYRLNRAYLVGANQKRTVMQFEGTLLYPVPGESFVLVNTEVRVREVAAGTKPHALLEVPGSNDTGIPSEYLERGFAVSEGAGFGDSEKSLWIKKIERDGKDADAMSARIEFSRGSDSNAKLNVGDTLQMHHFGLKVTHIEPPDKKLHRRGWIALEPVFAERVLVPQ